TLAATLSRKIKHRGRAIANVSLVRRRRDARPEVSSPSNNVVSTGSLGAGFISPKDHLPRRVRPNPRNGAKHCGGGAIFGAETHFRAIRDQAPSGEAGDASPS